MSLLRVCELNFSAEQINILGVGSCIQTQIQACFCNYSINAINIKSLP